MRKIPDRFWWFQGAIGALPALYGFIVLILLVIATITAFREESEVQWNSLLLVVGGCVLTFLISFIFIRGSLQGRERFHCRRQVICGNQEAMPRAVIQVHSDIAPDLIHEPLEVLWHITALSQRVRIMFYLLFFLVFISVAGEGVYAAYNIAVTNPMQLAQFALVASIVLVLSAVVVVPLFLVARFTCELPSLFGKPYGIVASVDGLMYQPRVGQSRFLRWEEIRLFEVEVPHSLKRQRYRLYGHTSRAEWWNEPPSRWVSLDMTREEFFEHHQALLNLIVARTHLLPRTFDQRLAASGRSARAN